MGPRAKRVMFTAVLVCLPFAAVALIEGTASLVLFGRALLGNRLAEESHTEIDTLLGWINKPNVNRPDFYAKGSSLRTNSQRFRHDGDIAPQPPVGKRRVVCSGDSFTLGFGVGDAQTWCALLAAESDSSLETVNMGQGGYGIDQAYLWYRRDGLPLRPDVHLFAFVVQDFLRMRYHRFVGYPKPQLVREGASVRAAGVPLPRPGLGRALAKLTDAARTLRSFTVLSGLFSGRATPTDPAREDSVTWELARATFRDLARLDSAAGAELVVVYLPTIGDFTGPQSDRWRRWASEASVRHEFTYLDLIEPLRHVPPDSVDAMFIKGGAMTFRAAAGHYTAAGNAWVAAELRRLVPALAPRPAVAARSRQGAVRP